MQNKTLQALLEATAAHTENSVEMENLGQELAQKLRGGQAQDDELESGLNVGCHVTNNTSCPPA